jgi:hypothetical protein
VANAEAYEREVFQNGGGDYWLALVYALATSTANSDDRISPAARKERSEAYAARAVQLLEQARIAGYFRIPLRRKNLEEAKEFAPLRARADFQTVIGNAGR